MYCSKCGAENKDDSLFCTKCGEKILDVNVKDDKGAEIKGVEKDKTNLFSAHLLNIIAFCLPVLMTLGMFLVIPQMLFTSSGRVWETKRFLSKTRRGGFAQSRKTASFKAF